MGEGLHFALIHPVLGGQVVVWSRFRPVDRRVAGSIADSTNFLTNGSGQATNALVSLFTKQSIIGTS